MKRFIRSPARLEGHPAARIATISSHRILALAAGMTYYSLLAIFPAIGAVVAVYRIGAA
jgi:membrane protein